MIRNLICIVVEVSLCPRSHSQKSTLRFIINYICLTNNSGVFTANTYILN